ncbi:MAG: glutamate--cysteine ligase [Candidatus Pacebacteria bacterium]|nr:glutamate--cysteine ligase [Candidatus Paceibacterota bacterium]
MAGKPSAGGKTIESKADLIAWFESGNKPKTDWRIGTEHEKFVFDRETLRPLPYEGAQSINSLLQGMTRFGWQPILEGKNIIALSHANGGAISLEPGGQFELSGAAVANLHQTCAEVTQHLVEVKQICDQINAGVIGMGFNPKWRREDIPWMPKGRYKIMRDYMPKVGKLGLDMMLRTCTVQVNLDYESEADMVKKFRTSLALQPIATALFAASPFTEGRPNGFQSYRSHIWTDTDHDRCGVLPFVFEEGFCFESYVDYLLDVPMYFVYRDGAYIDASGQSFHDFMAGRLPALMGEKPAIGDFIDHVSTVFPEVRLKKYLEMRGADAGPARGLVALPALWVGLLYDDLALDAAWDEVKDWTISDHETLRREVPRLGLAARHRGETVRDISLRILAIAREGLRHRAVAGLSNGGKEVDESVYLDRLFAIAASGRTLATEMLEDYGTHWNGDVSRVFAERGY